MLSGTFRAPQRARHPHFGATRRAPLRRNDVSGRTDAVCVGKANEAIMAEMLAVDNVDAYTSRVEAELCDALEEQLLDVLDFDGDIDLDVDRYQIQS